MGATLHVVREIARIAAEWRELAEHLDASPFARPEWLLIWWSAFGRGKLEVLALRDDDHGWLRLSFLRLDGRAISVDLSLEHGGRWYSLKAGYDEGVRGFAPGALHLHRLLRHACEHGAETFELLGDSDEFKRGWAKDERARHWLLSVSPSPGGRAVYGFAAARERVRPVARRLRRSR